MSAKSAPPEQTINNISWAMLKQMAPSFFALYIAYVTHPIDLIRMLREGRALEKQSGDGRKERQLRYVIPSYREGMRYSKSSELNLRPTYLCESNAPEIIAMANELGAFQKSDSEYAEACFNFLYKKFLHVMSTPIRGALRTLHTGEGVCFDRVSLFIALCRAAGIPARYRMYNEAFIEPMYEVWAQANPIMKAWYDSTGYMILHTMAEAFVDGKWQPAEFALTPDYAAAGGMPLIHFAEEAEGLWNFALPGAAVRFEELPRSLVLGINLGLKMAEAMHMMSLLHSKEDEYRQKGQKILDEMGEEEYDRRAKQTYKAALPAISRKLFNALKDADTG